MTDVDVVITMEHKNRELESAVALKVELEKLGYSSVVLQNSWGERSQSTKIRPRVVVTPWCYDEADIRTLCVYEGQIQGHFDILNLHCEQITSSDASSFMLPTGDARYVYHCAWGDYFKEQLLDSGVAGERICVTGSPRLDFFREEYRHLCTSREELAGRYGLDMAKPWVLVIGNYTAAFMGPEEIAGLESRGIRHAEALSKLSAATYDVVLDWLSDSCAEAWASALELIYRPHPSEPSTDRLMAIAKAHKNFHVIKDLAIRDWQLASNCALMWNSTSSVEAAYAGLPVFALRPKPIPENLKFELLELVEQIDCYDSLCSLLKRVISGELGACNDAFVNGIGYYYRRNDETATASTARFIADIIERGEGRFACERPPFYGLRKSLNYWSKVLALKLGVLGKFKRFETISLDRVTRQDVGSLEAKMKNARSDSGRR